MSEASKSGQPNHRLWISDAERPCGNVSLDMFLTGLGEVIKKPTRSGFFIGIMVVKLLYNQAANIINRLGDLIKLLLGELVNTYSCIDICKRL